MEIISALFGITRSALQIYETKQARQYLDRVIFLEKEHYAESNKPEDLRNHAYLDNIIHELCIISKATASFGKPIPED